MNPLILASGSPRRRELLEKTGLSFIVVTSQVEELVNGWPPRELARENARRKVETVAPAYPAHWVLGADTVVVWGEKIFGKPASLAQAADFLAELSGQTHEVITALALVGPESGFEQAEEVSRVTFKQLSPGLIQGYLKMVPVLDKAGGYALQDHGAWLIERTEGSQTNVIGLPMELLQKMLGRHGLIFPLASSFL